MSEPASFRANAFPLDLQSEDDPTGVLLGFDRMVIPMSIREARGLIVELQRAVEEACLKLSKSHS